MNNKGIGAIFCLISAILISVYYLTAAIFMSNVTSWNAGLFAAGLEPPSDTATLLRLHPSYRACLRQLLPFG